MALLSPATQLVVVTGKGGVGKSTVSLALALRAVADGRPVVLCEVGPTARAPERFGLPALRAGGRCALMAGLDCLALDPDEALREWLGRKVGRAGAAVLMRSDALASLIAAAPGARELTTIGKAWDLARGPARPLVVVDAPATGHSLALLRAPATFTALAGIGPVGREARAVRDTLRDPRQTCVIAVTAPTELAVAETLALDAGLRRTLGRGPDLLIINNVLERRFDADERAVLTAALERTVAPGAARTAIRAALTYERRQAAQQAALGGLDALSVPETIELPQLVRMQLSLGDVEHLGALLQISSGTISIAPAGHSRAQIPQPLQ